MQVHWLTVADSEFYFPLERAPRGSAYRPGREPEAGWTATTEGVWTHWRPDGVRPPEQGWKVHVCTVRDRLQHTLDTVADICFEEGLPFKHLSGSFFFTSIHHKHAPRAQAGKFCAAYPPDARSARHLMERLSTELKGEQGPYILSDRRYRDSKVVHYRYGANADRSRIEANGATVPLIRDGAGRDGPDVRAPRFVLPAGIEDPFAEPAAPSGGPVLLGGRFQVTGVIRHANGGGAYRAVEVASGRAVFVKEARGHNGVLADGSDARARLRREHDMLRLVHDRAPGLCPEPIAYLTEWEHDFLVTEFVDGVPFMWWVAANSPLGRLDAEAERHAEYVGRVGTILDGLRTDLDTLHRAGLRFGDVSPGNVVVCGDLTARLVGFETATSYDEQRSPLGTPGYRPSDAAAEAGVDDDAYGYAALALCALFPLTEPLDRDPRGRLALHRRDVELSGPIPEALWRTATRYQAEAAGEPTGGDGELPTSGESAPAAAELRTPGQPIAAARELPTFGQPAAGSWELPTPDELDREPEAALARLRDGLASELLAMARPDGEPWIFPPSPHGYIRNTHCVEHGTAGVLHALRSSGVPIPDELIARFRGDVMDADVALPPGLQAGRAGIAWVLADLGLYEEAEELLLAAAADPLANGSLRLAHGASGIGMAHLAMCGRIESDRLLRNALRVGNTLVADLDLVRSDAGVPGLESGLSGPALFLHALGRHTGDERYTRAAVALTHSELDRIAGSGSYGPGHADGSGTPGAPGTPRTPVMPQLANGSAGVATVLTRIAASTGDDRCLAALPDVVRGCRQTCSVEPGLYAGAAGWAFTLAEHARLTGDAGERAAAVRVATGLVKQAVRRPDGFRVLGSFETRYHADLGSGSAGVLLAVSHVLQAPGVHLFTAEPAAAQAASPVTPAPPA